MVSQTIPSVGLVVVVSLISTTTYVSRYIRRRITNVPITTYEEKISYGTGFLIKNIDNQPLVCSVAHLLPTQTDAINKFYIKLFDPNTKLSNIYSMQLLTYNRSIDVALFTLDSLPLNPTCLEWNTDEITPGQDCYIIGFPLADSQISIVKGSVRDPTYCFSNLSSGIDQIYHSAPVTEGNSGSCILDSMGKIIGIHAWGYNQLTNTYETFSGGPSSKSVYPIVKYMLENLNLRDNNNFFPRVILGINANLVNDLFRIAHFTNSALQNIDGIIISKINTNQSIALHNAKANTIKININDIITHIFDPTTNEFVAVGYTRESPVNILFRLPLTQIIKIKTRTAGSNYQTENIIEIQNPSIQTISQDSFYSILI